MKTTVTTLCALCFVGIAGCALDETPGEVGKPCTSDLDCDEGDECAPAESDAASRVCMPIAG